MNTDTENRPTQLTRLWLDNGGEDIQHWTERLTEQAARAGGTAEEQAAALSTSLEALADSRMIPDLGAGLAADLLGWAFAEIDFTAIARSYLRDWHDYQSREGEADS